MDQLPDKKGEKWMGWLATWEGKGDYTALLAVWLKEKEGEEMIAALKILERKSDILVSF